MHLIHLCVCMCSCVMACHHISFLCVVCTVCVSRNLFYVCVYCVRIIVVAYYRGRLDICRVGGNET